MLYKIKMKLYTFYTKSHEVLYKDWFLPSVKDNFEVVSNVYEQKCESGEYGSKNWPSAMACKTEMIIQAIKDNWNNIFIYSDVDIIFLQPIINIITKIIQPLSNEVKTVKDVYDRLFTDRDLVFQRHNHDNKICAGFFACRANEKILKLFSLIHKRTSESTKDGQDDQFFLQRELPRNRFDVKYALLPETFYSIGIGNAKRWKKGDTIKVPKNIVMFHANWCPKIEDKIYLLKYVKEEYEKINK